VAHAGHADGSGRDIDRPIVLHPYKTGEQRTGGRDLAGFQVMQLAVLTLSSLGR
jgi:hypothetical protein